MTWKDALNKNYCGNNWMGIQVYKRLEEFWLANQENYKSIENVFDYCRYNIQKETELRTFMLNNNIYEIKLDICSDIRMTITNPEQKHWGI